MSCFNLLDRARLTGPNPTALQSQVDGLVGGFAEQATDWRSLAAIMVGSAVYRVGRVGMMGLGSGSALRAASVGFGLAAEVSAFELTHRGLSTISPGAQGHHANLWQWSGPGGLRQGLLQSVITFGALKGAGRFTRAENVILQHLAQDLAMVAGHQISGALNFAPRPTGSLAEQFLHAEATNLQLGAGMSLAHRFMPAVHSLERGLDVSLSAPPPRALSPTESLSHAFATAGATGTRCPTEAPKGPDRLHMTMDPDGKNGGPRLQDTMDSDPARPVEEKISRVEELDDGKVRLVPDAVLDKEERYCVLKYLGSGGFGDVYLIRDTKFARDMVTKIPNSQNFDEGTLARFRQEGIIGGNLDPQYAARVTELVELRPEIGEALRRNARTLTSSTEPLVVPIMDYVPGHDLHTVLYHLGQNHPNLTQRYTLERRLEICALACEAVHSAHEQGVIHRDLKPENIRLRPDGRVVIMDYGVAKLSKEPSDPPPPGVARPELENLIEESGSPQTLHGYVTGTPGWIPPEAYTGAPPSRKTDIFALGMLGYQILSLRHPHTAYRQGDPGEPALVPLRDENDLTEINSHHLWAWRDPPSFEEIAGNDHPRFFYEAEKIFRRAFDPNEDARYETAAEMREDLLWVRARTDYVSIQKIREDMASTHRQMVDAHRRFSVRHQTPIEQWEAMHEPLDELKQMRKQWVKMAGDLITHLTARIPLLADPDAARSMIAELNMMLYLDAGDRAPKEVREAYAKAMIEHEVISSDPNSTGPITAALRWRAPVSLNAADIVTGRPLDLNSLRVDVFPLQRELNAKGRETGNYRVGKAWYRGFLGQLTEGLHLGAGYYATVFSHRSYAPLRLPLRVSVEDVRRFYQHNSPFPLRLEFIPENQVPKGFAVIHGGVATIGHDFYEEGVPTKVWSRPQFLETYRTFMAAMKPVSVGEYFEFIQHRLAAVNSLIQEQKWEAAYAIALEVREYLPRRRQVIPPLATLPANFFREPGRRATAFSHSHLFSELDLYWRLRVETDAAGNPRFRIENPSTHPDPNGDPIYLDQPMTAESNLGAEAYTQWRAEREGMDYFILSADQSELIARNGFPWYYPSGYRISPSHVVARNSFRDPNNDSYPQRIGTHPQGLSGYRDRSLFGPLDVVGNGRKFTGTHDEPETVVVVGGGPRNILGPYHDPWGRTSLPRNWADQSNGVFRLGLWPHK